MLGQNSAATPTIFHGFLSNLRLLLTFGFGDHHGRERGDKTVAERQVQSSGLKSLLLSIWRGDSAGGGNQWLSRPRGAQSDSPSLPDPSRELSLGVWNSDTIPPPRLHA